MTTVLANKIDELVIYHSRMSSLFEWVKGCYSDDPLPSMINIHSFLSDNDNALREEMIDTGVVSHIIKLLTIDIHQIDMLYTGYIRQLPLNYTIPADVINILQIICPFSADNALQDVGSAILCCLADGNSENATKSVKYLIDHKVIPFLVSSFSLTTSLSVKSIKIEALGNIARHNINNRDLVLKHDILKHIKQTLAELRVSEINNKHNADYGTLSECISWALLQLFQRQNKPSAEYITIGLEIIKLMFADCKIKGNKESKKNVCLALNRLSDQNKTNDWIINNGILNQLITFLDDDSSDVNKAALFVIGDIALGPDIQTMSIINGGVLNKFLLMLQNNKISNKYICWLISNIALTHPQSVINANLMSELVISLNEKTYSVAREALYAISNTINHDKWISDTSQIMDFIKTGVIEAFCKFMVQWKSLNNYLILAAMKVMLDTTDCQIRREVYKRCVRENGGLEILNLLRKQNTVKQVVYDEIGRIVGLFCEENEVSKFPIKQSPEETDKNSLYITKNGLSALTNRLMMWLYFR